MGIFTTREIAIFIYAVIIFAYILLHKDAQAALLSVIQAACHIKLIMPFLIFLFLVICFTWWCTYLPFWKWMYVKDIAFWMLFAGIPVCFNATRRELEDHYFRNIIVDNLKFTALVEFVTGTFTFHIICELLLQPFLTLFLILQSSLIKKDDAVKKIVDWLVGLVGLLIIGFTIKSVIDSIGDIQFIDIVVGFILPLVLSALCVPVAYSFALYSKYEILFLRMKFKEPNDKKLRRKHRLKVIRCCKLSYKKVCKFLNLYVKKMYTRMSNTEFEEILDEFRRF